MAPNPAIVLLSGGLDSATTLAITRDEGFEPYALSFSYGQRHAIELEAARAVARQLGAVRHLVMSIDLAAFGGSALTTDLPVPRPASLEEIGREIPVTYVPARNTIFLSFALGWAEVLGSSHIFIGVNALDYSGYPDCRPEFVEAFERLANLATRAAVEGRRMEIHAPLQHLAKREVILRGLALGVDYGLTRSCYDPDEEGRACGTCDACLLRLRGFEANGIPDPAPYQNRPST